jgi:UDP-N-acetyl-D-glucosamine dehydrogenase
VNQKTLLKKIKNKQAKIAVIGLGYVGLPLAILLAKSGFRVKGYARNERKLDVIANGNSDMPEFNKDLKKVLRSKNFSVNLIADEQLQTNDVFIICVPTPVHENKKPDLSSLKEVAKRLKKLNLDTKLIINESTVAPFTTRKIFGSLGQNYFLVCSPERINPGSSKTVGIIPKVIGGLNPESLELGAALYRKILKEELTIAKNMEVAEMSKMLENTYRAVNIALVNEFAQLADKINLDILDVIHAAESKWSFHPHYPGIGVGGHCIPVDPHYILKLAKDNRMDMHVISHGLLTNDAMPQYVAKKIKSQYSKGMSVLVYGLTYKKNVADLRESPVLVLCEILRKKKVDFSVYDPLLNKEQLEKLSLSIGKLKKVDILVVGTDHEQLNQDYKSLIGGKTIVIDGKNFFKEKVGKKIIGVGRTLE